MAKEKLTFAAIWDDLTPKDRARIANHLNCSVGTLALKVIPGDIGFGVGCGCDICEALKKVRVLTDGYNTGRRKWDAT